MVIQNHSKIGPQWIMKAIHITNIIMMVAAMKYKVSCLIINGLSLLIHSACCGFNATSMLNVPFALVQWNISTNILTKEEIVVHSPYMTKMMKWSSISIVAISQHLKLPGKFSSLIYMVSISTLNHSLQTDRIVQVKNRTLFPCRSTFLMNNGSFSTPLPMLSTLLNVEKTLIHISKLGVTVRATADGGAEPSRGS